MNVSVICASVVVSYSELNPNERIEDQSAAIQPFKVMEILFMRFFSGRTDAYLGIKRCLSRSENWALEGKFTLLSSSFSVQLCVLPELWAQSVVINKSQVFQRAL